MKLAFAIAALLALAACGSEPEAPATPETPMPVEPDGGIGDGAGPPEQGVDETLANRIPTRFHGAWDYVQGTCDPASDLRMEISGSEILFYEAVGMVTEVTPEGDRPNGDVVVTLAMEGEGETWEQKTRLSLVQSRSGPRLETSDGDGPRTVDEYPSKSCPA